MKIGIGEWGFREIPIEKHAELTAKIGAKYLELGIGGNFPGRIQTDMPASKLEEIKKSIKDYGLLTPFMCLENDFSIANRELLDREIERISSEVKFSKQFGAEKIRLFSGFTKVEDITEEILANIIYAIQKTAKVCAEEGMEISIETHGKIVPEGKGVKHCSTSSTELSLLDRILSAAPKNVGINYDPGNVKAVIDNNPTEFGKHLDKHINYCHLKDWYRFDDGTWEATSVGGGTMDWEAVLGAISFHGVYLIEYEPTHDVMDGIDRSISYLRSKFSIEF